MSWWSDTWHNVTDAVKDVGEFVVDMVPTAFNAVGDILPGGVGDVFSDIGSGIESYLNKEAAEDQLKNEQNFNAQQAQLNRDFQREERLQTQQFNIDMWNKTNEYNSPAAQLQRAQAAGINPNLVVSSLSRSTANPVTSSPMSGVAASSPGSLASSMLLQSAQIANLNANTRKANTDADINEQDYAYNNATFSDRVNSLKYANEETKARLSKLGIDTELQQQLYEFLAHRNEEELNQLRLLCDKTTSEINNLKKQGNMIDMQIEGASISNSLADIQLEFSRSSGIPQGTDVGEAIWKSVVNGNAGELVDLFVSGVEDYMKRGTKRTIKGLTKPVVDAATTFYDIAKPGFRIVGGLGALPLLKNPFFGGVTLPGSVRNP